jgi:acetylornithine deacetylase
MQHGDSIEIIRELVAFPTVSRNPNRELLAYTTRFLEQHGVRSDILWNADGSKGNLWATIGPPDVPGVILSGHSDVVPADEANWTGDPFKLRMDEGRIYGRGTCDMKGFIGTVLSAVPDLVRRKLKAPIHIAISYDEEVGCTGVASLIERLAALETKPALCIVGEPTSMQVMTGHKGVGMYKVTVKGKSAHSSQAPHAVNAIEYAAEIIAYIKSLAQEQMHGGCVDEHYDVGHSTISVNTIAGGVALNVVPELCAFQFDVRALAGSGMRDIVSRVEEFLQTKIIPRMRSIAPESDATLVPIVEVVGLETDVTHPAVTFLKRLVGRDDHGKLAYCTEAGMFSATAGIVSLVCGPGSMEQGHKADEFLAVSEIAACRTMIDQLAQELEGGLLPWSQRLVLE